MSARYLWLWFMVVLAAGGGLYALKLQVQGLEEQLTALRQDIRDDTQAIHVLRAEWSHLTDPARLRRLAAAHTDLVPVTPEQMITLRMLPFADTGPRAMQDIRPGEPVLPPGVPFPSAPPRRGPAQTALLSQGGLP